MFDSPWVPRGGVSTRPRGALLAIASCAFALSVLGCGGGNSGISNAERGETDLAGTEVVAEAKFRPTPARVRDQLPLCFGGDATPPQGTVERTTGSDEWYRENFFRPVEDGDPYLMVTGNVVILEDPVAMIGVAPATETEAFRDVDPYVFLRDPRSGERVDTAGSDGEAELLMSRGGNNDVARCVLVLIGPDTEPGDYEIVATVYRHSATANTDGIEVVAPIRIVDGSD